MHSLLLTQAPYINMKEANDKSKKQIPLRVSSKLYEALAKWADDDFRSINGQIEYLLTECVKKRGIRLSDEDKDQPR